MMPKISIVIVNWNTLELMKKCLASIDANGDVPYELLITDNGSEDKSAEFLNSYVPQNPNCLRYECTLNGKDYGFAVAVNQGIRKVRSEFILLLNPDTEMFPNTLLGLLAVAEKYPKMGAMGAKLIFPDGRDQHTVSRFPTLFSIIGLRLRLNKIFPNNTFIQKRLAISVPENIESVVDHVRGALFFIRGKTLKQVGLFDEGYFLWFEETDFCKRLKNTGWDVMYSPYIKIIHQSEASISEMNFWERQAIYNKSLRRYFRKHFGFFHSILGAVLDPLCTVLAMAIFRK